MSSLFQGVEKEDLASITAVVGKPLEALAGKTLLVAGYAGFLPGYLARAILYANDFILDSPCRIICLDNFSTGLPDIARRFEGRPDFVCFQQSITNPIDLPEWADYVVHGASIASPPRYRQYPLETIAVNVTGTQNLLEKARQRGVSSFLYLSTSEVYGDPSKEDIPTPETYRGNVSFTGPRSCYGESKRLAETLCTIYHDRFSLPVKVARPFNVYGPYQRLDDGRVIPDLLSKALRGETLTLFSDGGCDAEFQLRIRHHRSNASHSPLRPKRGGFQHRQR